MKECQEKKIKYEVGKEKCALSMKEIEKFEPFHWDVWFGDVVESGGFDIILTNPPWDKVKLEDAEFLREYDQSIKKNGNGIKEKLKKALKNSEKRASYEDKKSFYKLQSNYFKAFYEHQTGEILRADGTSKLSSADMDCYRLFMERCIGLIKNTGRIGIVIPSGLGKDDGSTGLRRYIFNNIKIEGLIDFQNQQGNGKGKIFEGVHPQFTFGLVNLHKTKPCDKFPAMFGARDLKLLENFPEGSVERSIKKIKEMSPRNCSIIEFKDPSDEKIILKAKNFPALGEKIEGTWNVHIYGEFHETGDKPLFKNKKIDRNHLPLYKGGAIYQYEYDYNPEKADRYVNKNAKKVLTSNGFAFKNKCYKNYRLVVRDVARATDERTLISSFIPKNSFTANTLHCVSVDNYNLLDIVLVIQGLLNSFTVDYFTRQTVKDHVNKRHLVKLHIPRIKKGDAFFNELVKRSALLTCTGAVFNDLADEIGIKRGGVKEQSERWRIQAEIDAMVAHIYGLTREEYSHILSTFKTGREVDRRETLKRLSMEEFDKMAGGSQKAA